MRSAVIDLIVDGQFRVSGGVVVFDVRQVVLIIVVRQSIAEFIEGKSGLELLTNMSSKNER